MSDRYLLTFLHDDESLQFVVRTSFLRQGVQLGALMLLVILDIFFYFPLQRFGTVGVAAFWGVLIIALLRCLYLVYLWQRNACIVTNRRLIDIDRRSLFEKRVAEAPLEQIQDIRYNQKGLFQTLFNVGTVMIDFGNQRGRIELQQVAQPRSLHERFTRLHQHHSKKQQLRQEESEHEGEEDEL